MNKVLLTGRITKDPEIRYTSNGTANLLFTLAVDSTQRDATGNRQAFFISCVAWGQQADFMSRYVKKGNMLVVEGRIQTGQFQGQDGQVRYTTDVVVERIENLSPREANQNQQPQQQQNPYQGYNNPSYGQQNQYQQPTYNQQPSYDENNAPKSFDVDVDDNDLPF